MYCQFPPIALDIRSYRRNFIHHARAIRTLTPQQIKPTPGFVGRDRERKILTELGERNESAVIVVHGRRRIGKTELIEQSFRERNLLKFEGLEGQPEIAQKKAFLLQLSRYAGDPVIATVQPGSWLELLQLLADLTTNGRWTIFLEELQWLACYQETLISELKYIWDNTFRRNPGLILVLCGSSPSIMVDKVVQSRALHSRDLCELPLEQFSLAETRSFLGKCEQRRETAQFSAV